MKGVIDSCNRTKSGKSTMVLINGTKYLCNKLDIEQYVGKEIDYETGAYKDFKTIEKFTVNLSGGGLPGRTEAASGGNGMAYMPFISNTVAHAIAAGLIKQPSEISAWVSAAKSAVVNADDPY